MLRSRGLPRAAGSGRGRTEQRPAVTAAAWALAVALGTAGCATSAVAGQTPPVQAATGYVPVPVTPGLTSAYLVIRNYTSHADSLIAVRTSAGGRVSFQAPAGRSSSQMRSVPAIALPADATVRLVPDGPHLLITGIGHVQNGKVITLTLIFRHAGRVQVQALVTDPSQTGGNSNYFMN